MVTVTYNNGVASYNANAFFQYDYGQVLEIHGLTIPNGTQFHFAPKNSAAYIALCTTASEVTTVNVPQKALETHGEMNVYIFFTTETSGITKWCITFNVRKREKPGNYAPPDEPYIIEELQSQLDQIIQTGIADYEPEQSKVNAYIAEYVPANLITNNLAVTAQGTALDARQGKILKDLIDAINNSFATINTVTAGANITINSGGYIKTGRLVYVHLKVTASTSIAAYTPICNGLPSPLTGVKVSIINDATAASVDGAYKDGTGGVAFTTPLAAGTYNVTCFYFSAS